MWFALDYKLGLGARPFIFQSENFIWFTLQMIMVFLLFRLIPGGNYYSTLFGTFLYGLHPVLADTINYPLQRGTIMGSFGVIAGLVLWIFWPRLLPQTFPLKLKRVPEHGFDEFLRKNYQTFEKRYLRFIHLPLGLYLWPVIPALLVDPAAAVFAPILLAYILTVDREKRPRHAIPAAVLCGAYWIFQTAFTWRLGEFSRVPAANYWITQPWVAMRYFYAFFAPVALSADSDLAPFAHFWSPLALAGYAGLAALVGLAIWLGRKNDWRSVAFGLWWFLIALLPYAAIPHRTLEADWRMYLPFVGLALAASRAAWILFAIAYGSRLRIAALVGMPAAALAVLAACGWATYQRNEVWESEASLWSDVMAKSPHNGRAFMNFGLTRMDDDSATGLNYLVRASTISPNDALIDINLAYSYNRVSRTTEAEARFQRAVADGASWSPSYSWYAEWLQSHGRNAEGSIMAFKALAIDPYDLKARRTLFEIVSAGHDWVQLKKLADDMLRLYPNDPDGARALEVAQNGMDQLVPAEKEAKDAPSVEHYLDLSVKYYNNERYDDCIRAAREALRINPNLGEAYANIASAYHTMGKVDETITALREEVRLNPNLPSATHNLDVMLAEKARTGK